MNTTRTAQAAKKQQTAAQAYAEHVAAIDAQLVELRAALTAHAAKQATDPRNWGYAGDLGHVSTLLVGAVRGVAV